MGFLRKIIILHNENEQFIFLFPVKTCRIINCLLLLSNGNCSFCRLIYRCLGSLQCSLKGICLLLSSLKVIKRSLCIAVSKIYCISICLFIFLNISCCTFISALSFVVFIKLGIESLLCLISNINQFIVCSIGFIDRLSIADITGLSINGIISICYSLNCLISSIIGIINSILCLLK